MSNTVMFPHIFRRHTTQSMMLCVVVALLPLLGWIVAMYGQATLQSLQYFLLWCLVWELIASAIVRRFTLPNGSSLVTALILTLSFPPHLSMAMAAQIAFVAITIGKWLFGGLGFNLVNPAMLGRTYAWLAWPEIFENTLTVNVDNPVVSAVVNFFKVEFVLDDTPVLWGGRVGLLGNVSLVLIVLGALWLLAVRVLPWVVSLAYLFSFALIISVVHGQIPPMEFLIEQIGSSSVVFVAFFMATDMAMMPATWHGRGLYGAVMGGVTAAMMVMVRHEVAVMTSLLIANLMAPLITGMTMSKPFSTALATLKEARNEFT